MANDTQLYVFSDDGRLDGFPRDGLGFSGADEISATKAAFVSMHPIWPKLIPAVSANVLRDRMSMAKAYGLCFYYSVNNGTDDAVVSGVGKRPSHSHLSSIEDRGVSVDEPYDWTDTTGREYEVVPHRGQRGRPQSSTPPKTAWNRK
jgi:hypothetical protein